MRHNKVDEPVNDNPEWTAEEAAKAVSLEALPASLRDKLAGIKRRGPQKSDTKQRITIRLSRTVVEHFRATGDGWQTRMDAALQDWLKTHSATQVK